MTARATLWCCAILLGTWLPSQAVAQDWLYEARPGDTLWDLCLQYTARPGCWKELAGYNNITNERTMAPGQEIRIPVSWLLALPVVAEVLNVNGEVSYQEQHGAAPQPLRSGQTLVLGSLVRCAEGSARLRLSDNSEMLLRPGSVLELTSMSGGSGPGQATELQLERGELEIEVPPASRSRFEVHTPSAIAAVRGTQYRVVSDNTATASTRGEVLAGRVAVQAGATVEVPAGFGVKARQGQAPGAPRKLLAAPTFAQPRIDAPLPLTVHWSADPGAVAWLLDVHAANASGELLASHRTQQASFEFVALQQGCYHLVVRAIDQEGFNGFNGELPLCVLPPVEEPRTYWDLVIWSVMAALMLL